MPALKRAREQGKRAVCLSNLKQLTLAWIMYADDNDDKLVCSEAGWSKDALGQPWVGTTCAPGWEQGEHFPENDQIKGIKAGALFPYCPNVKLYRCPTGCPGELLTYAMMISINGRPVEDSPVFKRRMLIPQPADRLIFIDEGLSSPNSYSTRYSQPKWWDQPVTRHSDGTNFAYGDGRAGYHKWKGIETIKQGRDNVRTWVGLFAPVTEEGKEDLQWVQRGIWGKLGYEP